MSRRAAIVILLVAVAVEAAPPASSYYYDDTTGRQVTVTDAGGKLTLTVRFAGVPGSPARWFGEGSRRDGEITFSQIVGEDQDRGTQFMGKVSDSRLEIAYRPKQSAPADAGINGTYRRVSDDKRISLAKKEVSLADDALVQALRTAPKNWPGEDRPVAAEWKERWPQLRARWLALQLKLPPAASPTSTTAGPSSSAASNATNPKVRDSVPAGATADYWITLAEASGMGTGFLNNPLDKTIPSWEGEYDDGFYGHVSLRMGSNGGLQFTMNGARGSGNGEVGDFFGQIPAGQITKGKNGDLVATYTHKDAELKSGDQPATVKLRKTGHFIIVETQYAQRYCGRGWFDGIYRWYPVPKE